MLDAIMLDDNSCKIHLQESKKLLRPEKSRNSQMCIEFSDLCYSTSTQYPGRRRSETYTL
ncbi:ATP-binding cassette sub-family G member 1 [Temnothorax longispinosus]|uniref:ATP-binding cassette sub-family G member 1 n=1 Tax=Temnothorax longispinosus TaxID=300112 RepID=A0A4S2L630_9HYME|nr:ATP-binding cassette sub-family G member 1 [Temnothorax longispinosus]